MFRIFTPTLFAKKNGQGTTFPEIPIPESGKMTRSHFRPARSCYKEEGNSGGKSPARVFGINNFPPRKRKKIQLTRKDPRKFVCPHHPEGSIRFTFMTNCPGRSTQNLLVSMGNLYTFGTHLQGGRS